MIKIIGPILSAFLGAGIIPKKAPYCLWVLEVKRVTNGTVSTWSNRNPLGNSARRCGKAAKQYVDKGVPLGSIMILPKGILPPTVTIAEMQAGIISGIHTAGATQTYTLPTATDTLAGINFGLDEAIEWSLINESLAEADTITVAANTDHLLMGAPVIQSAYANTGGKYGNAATFRTRRLSDDTFVTYRKS